MKILKFPDKALLTKCEDVTVFDDDFDDILQEMWRLMAESNGMGLSANQVGILKNFFIMQGPMYQRINCINPKILSYDPLMANQAEACLSAPGEFLTLNRSSKIILTYKDEYDKENTREFSGIYAVCIQHEIDHLLGKVFFQAEEVPKKAKKRLNKKWGMI